MSRRVWQCDTCKAPVVNQPWECPACGKETCESCFDRYAQCKPCCEGKTDTDLRNIANKAGYEFED